MTEFLTNPNVVAFLWIAMLLLFVGFFVKAIYNTIRSEKRRRKYSNTMKVNDSIYFPCASGSIDGEILEINGDEVKVVVTVSKSRIYERN